MKNNPMEDFSKLEKELGIEFNNKELLIQAFCHRSYLNENPGFKLSNNERLEFLGDAVLELVVTDHLFRNYENQEGELTSWRAALVNSESLAETSRKLGFEKYLLLSKGEKKDTGKARNFILANTFESFIGALYIDQGYDAAKAIIDREILSKLPRILKEKSWRDFKSQFQEVSQEKAKITPTYKVLKEWGPDHNKHFVVGVFLEDNLIAEGNGTSKQDAEEDAARNALKLKMN